MNDLLPSADLPVAPPPPPRRRGWLRWLLLGSAFVGALLVALGALALGTGYADQALDGPTVASHLSPPPPELAEPDVDKRVAAAGKSLAKLQPKGPFIVIDRVQNRLRLVEDGHVTLDAVISAGAGSVLDDPTGKRKWVFDTPVGRFKVKGRREDPLWTAPDWEYIESGEPFPKRYSDRVQEGMLGEYALDLDAPGYMIHGTLYTRLLGRNVSHGCIRVGRDDLRVLWKKCPIGTSVFIY